VATLVFVPAVFSMLHGGKGEDAAAQREYEQQPQHA
jgi:hypothetical protein